MGYVGVWILCGIIAGAIYRNRGNSGFAGFLAGLILGPIGIILVLVTKPNTAAIEQRQLASGEMKKCPACAELVRSDARVCRYCQHDLTAAVPGRLAPAQRAFAKPNGAGGFTCSACGGGVRHDATDCKHCKASFAI